MNCLKCHSEIQYGWRFCPHCQQPLAWCPQCQAALDPGWQACPFCQARQGAGGEGTGPATVIKDSMVRELKQDFSSHVHIENKLVTVVQGREEGAEGQAETLLQRARAALLSGHAMTAVKAAKEALSLVPSSAEASLYLALGALSKGPLRSLTREQARDIAALLSKCRSVPATAECATYALAALCHSYYGKCGYSEPEPGFEQLKSQFYEKWHFLSDESQELVRGLGVENDFEIEWCG